MKKMRVDDLKKELDMRGISNKGKKEFLLEKLRKAMVDKVTLLEKKTKSAAPNGFADNALWHLIDKSKLPTLKEVRSEFEGAYAPSDRNGTSAKARKYNYLENWNREKFDGVTMQPVKDADGNLLRNRHEEVKYEMQPIKELLPDYAFVKKHKLDRYVYFDFIFLFSCVPLTIPFS